MTDRGDTVPAPNRDPGRVHSGTARADASPVTAVVNWRGDAPRIHQHLPLPEPPRTRHVSKASREPKDRTTRAFEEWLSDLAVARTIDAD
jgi:hypothetical protein